MSVILLELVPSGYATVDQCLKALGCVLPPIAAQDLGKRCRVVCDAYALAPIRIKARPGPGLRAVFDHVNAWPTQALIEVFSTHPATADIYRAYIENQGKSE